MASLSKSEWFPKELLTSAYNFCIKMFFVMTTSYLDDKKLRKWWFFTEPFTELFVEPKERFFYGSVSQSVGCGPQWWVIETWQVGHDKREEIFSEIGLPAFNSFIYWPYTTKQTEQNKQKNNRFKCKPY